MSAARRRSPWGTIALIAAAISGLALAVLLVGNVAGIEGANGDDEIWNVGWIVFTWGAVITLISGAVAYLRGRGRNAADESAGKLSLGYLAVAAVGFAVLLALA